MTLPPIEQAKNHILNNCLPGLKPEHQEMWIPCLPEDYDDYRQALELPEVLIPDIVIATVEDAANGRLERYLKSRGL